MDTLIAIQEGDIPALKEIVIFFAEVICKHFNDSLDEGKFSNCLKLANVTPAFKKSASIEPQKITMN